MRPRDNSTRQQVDHARMTGNDWVDFDPIEMMLGEDLDALFDRRSGHQKARHRNFITYVAG
eukprot:6562026-Karenia_brevis.AAC.1